MNSINNNINLIKRQFVLAFAILVGISTTALAAPVEEAEKLTKKEAKELILQVKDDLNIEEEATPIYDFDVEGNIVSTPVKTIKIYDENNALLLEAPINKVEELNNKYLSRLINASDFLIENNSTSYYRLHLK